MDFRAQDMTFEEADAHYVRLKELQKDGILSDEEFGYLLKRRMVRDEAGHWWAKSGSTGEWHYHDGDGWVKGTPPLGRTEPERGTRGPSFGKPTMEELLEICARYDGPGFYVGDSIPDQALGDARTYFPIPPGEGVTALVSNSPEFGLAICQEGVRWASQEGILDVVKRGVIGWSDFAKEPIQANRRFGSSGYKVRLGKGQEFVSSNRAMDYRKLVSLLQEIQTLIAASPPS